MLRIDNYPDSFLYALDRWQKGGDKAAKAKRGERLKREVLALNDEFLRACGECVYRRLALPQSDIWTFVTTGRLPEAISAWTVDEGVAKGIKGGVPEEWRDGKRWFGVILQRRPQPQEVVANLERLYVDLDFQRVLAETDATKYTEGIRRYGNSQREVVLEVPQVSLKNIWSWGGYGSPIEELAPWITGTPASAEDVAWLRQLAEDHNVPLGARWVMPTGARNVTLRVLDRARALGYPVPNDTAFLP